MEMYKNPRSESNIIHRLQKLGFRETMGYTDGAYQLMKQDSNTLSSLRELFISVVIPARRSFFL